MSLLPIMFKIEGKSVAVIGAGSVAARQIPKLIEAGCKDIIVYSPSLHGGLQPFLDRAKIKWIKEAVIDSLLFEEDILFLTTNNPDLHLAIYEKRRPSQLVYMADNPELSDFHFPMALAKGSLTITVSTGGASPTYGKKLLNEIENILADSIEEDLSFLESARKQVLDSGLTEEVRRNILQQLTNRTFLREKERDSKFKQILEEHKKSTR